MEWPAAWCCHAMVPNEHPVPSVVQVSWRACSSSIDLAVWPRLCADEAHQPVPAYPCCTCDCTQVMLKAPTGWTHRPCAQWSHGVSSKVAPTCARPTGRELLWRRGSRRCNCGVCCGCSWHSGMCFVALSEWVVVYETAETGMRNHKCHCEARIDFRACDFCPITVNSYALKSLGLIS